MIGISAFNSNYEGFYRVVRVLDIAQDFEATTTLDLTDYNFKAVAIRCTAPTNGEAYLSFDGSNNTVIINVLNYTSAGAICPLGYIFPGKVRKIGIPSEQVTITSKPFKVYLLD